MAGCLLLGSFVPLSNVNCVTKKADFLFFLLATFWKCISQYTKSLEMPSLFTLAMQCKEFILISFNFQQIVNVTQGRHLTAVYKVRDIRLKKDIRGH